MESNVVPAASIAARRARVTAGYIVMILLTIAVFLLIRRYGEGLEATAAGTEPIATTAYGVNIFLRVLLALTAVIALGRLLARLFAYIGQPPVIGEVVAGILLGPSLLGPTISAVILPPAAAPFLGIVAQVGVVLYMFLVGLDLNATLLTERVHAAVATSHAGILIPFTLGALLALPLYTRYATRNVTFTAFALFLGVSMAITAFPVLARILTDYRLASTRLGAIALSCAAVDDVTAWCLLAFVTGVARAAIGDAILVVAGAVIFIAMMFLFVRPALRWLLQQWPDKEQQQSRVTLILFALLLSAMTAEAIGIHALFGAFLLGAIIPRSGDAVRAAKAQLEGVVTILLLPAFFAFTGMRTRIDLLSEPRSWVICLIIIGAASAGKFGGTLVAARVTGLGWRSASMLGALMNTRGLMELIVLNVGLELRIISPTLFAMMVLMALATTMLTSPVVRALSRRIRSSNEADMLVEITPAVPAN